MVMDKQKREEGTKGRGEEHLIIHLSRSFRPIVPSLCSSAQPSLSVAAIIIDAGNRKCLFQLGSSFERFCQRDEARPALPDYLQSTTEFSRTDKEK